MVTIITWFFNRVQLTSVLTLQQRIVCVIWPAQYFVEKYNHSTASTNRNTEFALLCLVNYFWGILAILDLLCGNDEQQTSVHNFTIHPKWNDVMLCTPAKKNKTIYYKWCPVTVSANQLVLPSASSKKKKRSWHILFSHSSLLYITSQNTVNVKLLWYVHSICAV